MKRRALAPHQELDTTAFQFSQLQVRVHVESEPDPGHIKTGPSDTAPSLSVAVMELPSPPLSPSQSPYPVANAPDVDAKPPARAAPGTFPYFPLLPAELRLKIWHLSFLPRTVELHTRRTHYADDEYFHGITPKWQSQSRNPAALSVSTEARDAALECYTVALPLAVPPRRDETFARPGGDMLQESDRLLYINLQQDTVVVLGDLHFARLTRLLEWFRKADAPARRRNGAAAAGTKGKGLRRLAMSVAPWWTEVAAATLKAFACTIFADLEEFVLFMYSASLPPPSWTGGHCVLEEVSVDADYYRRFVVGKGRQFRAGNGFMVVGQRPMKVADLSFDDGW